MTEPAGTLARTHLAKVLVVEDEPRLRELLVDVIPQMGFSARAVRGAEEALRMLETDPYDVVILDLQLPGMSGMELFEKLHASQRTAEVIILTAYGDLPTAQRAIQLGVVEFLSKPFHLGDLERALERAWRRIRASLPPPRHQDRPVSRERPATLAEAEREQILAALRRNGGNRTAAALELGVSRRMLHYRLAHYQSEGLHVD